MGFLNNYTIWLTIIIVLVATIKSSYQECLSKTGFCKLSEKNSCADKESTCYSGTKSICTEAAKNDCCCVKPNPIYKHLSIGSPQPSSESIPNDKYFRVYFMHYCPYCHRTGLVLAAKNLTVLTDFVFVNLKNRPEWFNNFSGSVPTLETSNKVVNSNYAGQGIIKDSLIVSDYLDESFPSIRPMYPDNTFKKAQDRLFIDKFNKLIPPLFSNIITGSGFKNETPVGPLIEQFKAGLVQVEEELNVRGTKYFSGDDEPGIVDYMIWPWFERRPVIHVFYSAIDYTVYSNTLNDEAVLSYGFAPQLHYAYLKSVREGNTNYDFLAGVY